MKGNSSRLLSKLEALAARTPTRPDHIQDMLEYVLKLLQHQFEAYLIDIMWEDKQAIEVELRAVKMLETEKNGYHSRRVYQNQATKPTSLTGWCYVNSSPVWIVDANGLSTQAPYQNLFYVREEQTIPPGTIYAYNQKKMKTEICVPLKTRISSSWERTAGVLNIELEEVMQPTPPAWRLVDTAADIISQLQNRLSVIESAELWSTREFGELRGVADAFENEKNAEPSLYLSAFIVRPFGLPGADSLYYWVKCRLQARGIRVKEIATTEQIVPAMWEAIRASHFGIVISTGWNENVLLEWGFLLGSGKPVIRLHQDQGGTEKEPFNVTGTKRYEYAKKGDVATEDGVRTVLDQGLMELFRERADLRQLGHQMLGDDQGPR